MGKSARAITTSQVMPDDDGIVVLAPALPETRRNIVATLRDPDGGETNITWQWARSPNGTTDWTDIQGATREVYTPLGIDEGNFLRVTVNYTDAVGPGKSAQAITSSAVAQAALLRRYDADGNGAIDRNEAIEAVRDYFNDELTNDDVVSILILYYAS